MLHRVAIVLLIAGCCFSSSATAEDAVSDLPAEQAPAALPTLDKRLICRTIEAAAVENDLPVDFLPG
jgi:hypothetical protein